MRIDEPRRLHMPSNTLAAAVLATGIWVVFAFAIVVGLVHGPNGDARLSASAAPKIAAAR
jgi:hypothetical protein